ncbi:hypothetical protein FNW02_32745 [Komarekiella sp. 'clone 1']|uniref:Relaxase n=1 Tax=Komarekiella delphini-convector SJRDD-AB1 TaxID=2593771 RepID=A0AA40T4B8_9NOST|nr:relaxase/mobilization nuclease domain-containing protein [Komarekiella delphini-convector]MBD6620425.1 hypothetical protein [Komarekiella delphini-convector SJRDD-AB1]
MIGKQTKGRGFRKLLDYLESRENAQLIGGNMSGRNARELAREFRLSRQLNSDADRVVYHVSLSAAKGDLLDDEKWKEIGSRYMKEMGFDANQFVIFRHHNTDDDHIHIAASRIRMDTGRVVHDSWDYVRSEKVLRQIELDYELVQVIGSREKLNRTPSTGQIRRIIREQSEFAEGRRDTPPERTIKEQIQQTIDSASVDNPLMPEFIMRLQVSGISLKTGFTRNGKSKGISYEKDGQAFSGTQLGAAYTFPGLQKHRGVDYQAQRDDGRINEVLLNPVKSLPQYPPQKQIISAQTPTQPQFTPPPEDESLSGALQNYLTMERGLLPELVQLLHRQGLTYVDQKRNIVFIKRGLDGEKLGARVWSIREPDNRTFEYDKNTLTSKGWFHINLGKEPNSKIERVFLCSSPIDALSLAVYTLHAHSGLPPPNKTMYMAVDDPENLPLEFLRNFPKIGVAFNNDEQGNKVARAIQELLPQSKRLAPNNPDWNAELLAYLQHEQLERKQEQRGLSR